VAETGPLLGAVLELDVGEPAAGGACVARHGDDPAGRVVFVRHALPGERVRARVVEDRGGSFCRADAIEILRATPDRVTPPCPHAGPGRCGGCDWQHVTGAAQRELKATVLRDQFARLANLDVSNVFDGVEELPGGLLGWRTRIAYAVSRDGRVGLRQHGSHRIEHLDHCPLGVPGVADAPVPAAGRRGLTGIEVVRSDGPGDQTELAVLEHRPGYGRQQRGRRPPDRIELVSGPGRVQHTVGQRRFAVAPGGFWQVHPAAAETFTAVMLDGLRPRPGEVALDLYAGAGALTAALADAVGPTGRVVGLEADGHAVADATRNLDDLPWAEVRQGRVRPGWFDALDVRPDLAVLDPPRAGAGAEVMAALAGLGLRALCYVSCDPATLARDVAALGSAGWRLSRLRAFDAFPMTHHIECVALLHPDSAADAP
jgi:tRNA/tmRNA/rRNA uracil-C5-methylase (TrmA/RlmC/RlmD family)